MTGRHADASGQRYSRQLGLSANLPGRTVDLPEEGLLAAIPYQLIVHGHQIATASLVVHTEQLAGHRLQPFECIDYGRREDPTVTALPDPLHADVSIRDLIRANCHLQYPAPLPASAVADRPARPCPDAPQQETDRRQGRNMLASE